MKKKFKHKSQSYYREKAKKVHVEASKIAEYTVVSISSIVYKARETVSNDITYEEVWRAILQAIDVTEEDLQSEDNGQYFEGTLFVDKVVQLSYIVDKANTTGEDWEVYVPTKYLVDVYELLLHEYNYLNHERGN